MITATIAITPKTQLQPPFGPSVDSPCHPWFTATHLSYRLLILKLPPPPCAALLVDYFAFNDTGRRFPLPVWSFLRLAPLSSQIRFCRFTFDTTNDYTAPFVILHFHFEKLSIWWIPWFLCLSWIYIEITSSYIMPCSKMFPAEYLRFSKKTTCDLTCL